MKVLRVQINDFLRFQNFNLELTYPNGHPRAGQPLDKICIIGQSGTGKTSLLRLLVRLLASREREGKAMESPLFFAEFQAGRHKQCLYLEPDDETLYTPQNPRWDKNNREDREYVEVHKPWLIHFPADLLEKGIDQLMTTARPNTQPFLTETEAQARKVEFRSLKDRGVYDFSQNLQEELWTGVFIELKKFDDEDRLWQKQLTQSLLNNQPADSLLDQYRTWKLTNPLIKLSLALEPMLAKFNLELKTEVESADDLNYLTIRSKDGAAVPFKGWSTGTKQLLSTAAPMCFLDTRQTVILVDEPERSLYPDVQRQVIPLYRSLAPESQLIVATHSPVIASSFEPWEILKLDFDEKGHVVHTKNWDEARGRTVESYTYHPQYLRWDSILRYFFDVEEEGNQQRMEMLAELAKLEVQMRQLKEQSKQDELAAAWSEYKQKANRLDWKLPHAKN